MRSFVIVVTLEVTFSKAQVTRTFALYSMIFDLWNWFVKNS